jgi:hypothetical protein
MKTIGLVFAAAGFAVTFAAGPALAQGMNQDDLKWVNRCISDNGSEAGGTPEIVRAYCICMNEKMDSTETRSITQWEKANPGARKDCEAKSGWK